MWHHGRELMYNYHVATSSIAALPRRFIAIQYLVNTIFICSCAIVPSLFMSLGMSAYHRPSRATLTSA